MRVQIIVAVIFLTGTSYTSSDLNKKRNIEHFSITAEDLAFDDYEMLDDIPFYEENKPTTKLLKNVYPKLSKISQRVWEGDWPEKDRHWEEEYKDIENDYNKNKERRDLDAKETTEKQSAQYGNSLNDTYWNKKKEKNSTFHQGKGKKGFLSSLTNTENLNCSDNVEFGIQAVKCIRTYEKNDSRLFMTLTKLVLGFILVLLSIATALWCAKGWCCCCCPFKFCKVSDRLEEIKYFVANNPPGRLQTENTMYDYEPAPKELIYYDNIANGLMTI